MKRAAHRSARGLLCPVSSSSSTSRNSPRFPSLRIPRHCTIHGSAASVTEQQAREEGQRRTGRDVGGERTSEAWVGREPPVVHHEGGGGRRREERGGGGGGGVEREGGGGGGEHDSFRRSTAFGPASSAPGLPHLGRRSDEDSCAAPEVRGAAPLEAVDNAVGADHRLGFLKGGDPAHGKNDAGGGGGGDESGGGGVGVEARVDPRVWPIAASTLITGSAIGVALPVMPLFAAELGLSTAEFGLIGSVFGGTRLLSNIPLAVATEHLGRRPFLTLGPAITALSMVGTGLSASLPTLLAWRVVTGIGGSAQMTGASLYLADISRPENRARTLAPMTAAFSAGASVGPAVGGVLADSVGIGPTFFFVGGAIGVVSLMNYALLPETKLRRRRPASEGGEGEAARTRTPMEVLEETTGRWRRLLENRNVQTVMLTHLAYWFTVSGSQFTLMPLLAVEHLHMTPAGTGSIFAMVSAVNVIGSQLSAQASDRFGRKATILPGLSLITAAVLGIPMATEGNHLTALMAVWAVGGAFVSTGPTAFMADVVSEEDRPQALAMLRTMGDLGLLLGAGSMGSLAALTSMETAFHINAGVLAAATSFFALRAVEPRSTIRQEQK